LAGVRETGFVSPYLSLWPLRVTITRLAIRQTTVAGRLAFVGTRQRDRKGLFCVASIPLDIGATNRAHAQWPARHPP
jgi:hypothetical protein